MINKLEAVRPAGAIPTTEDIADSATINEVDAVIATHELADLFTKHGVDVKGFLKAAAEDSSALGVQGNFDNDLADAKREITSSPYYSTSSSWQSSNGYAEYILHKVISDLKDKFALKSEDFNLEELKFKQVRNKDFKEVTLKVRGLPVLKLAQAYGFRNIQNIVRSIKRDK
eukprot:CAMPEP_0168353134 /NCGR_PEP_ID=MMETSP0213-20121227/23051_1 /TAXON_ID=151035 /ORGANISM="Euplotes harpa, Strain FSP1.4" /LENGTH=171 /DNA_ID=CAMNT_0008364649 /DNA_START=833 /DNA_END=1348 /DNA_ORIENTATION=+